MDNKYQYCKWCKQNKVIFLFPRNVKSKNGHSLKCKKCENKKQQVTREIGKNWKYPYKGLNDPKYLEDKNELFSRLAKQSREDMGFDW